jgi:hypothetical protein
MFEEIRKLMLQYGWMWEQDIYAWTKGSMEVAHESAEFLQRNNMLDKYLKEKQPK